MRRFFLIGLLLAALAGPAATLGQQRGAGDGSVSIVGGDGVFVISGRGAVIGQLDRGSVQIFDPIASDGSGPIVSGYEHVRNATDPTPRYSGTDVDFRIIGGTFRIQVVGRGVDLSFVGRGQITVVGLGTSDDGRYSVDGGSTYRPVPATPTVATIGS